MFARLRLALLPALLLAWLADAETTAHASAYKVSWPESLGQHTMDMQFTEVSAEEAASAPRARPFSPLEHDVRTWLRGLLLGKPEGDRRLRVTLADCAAWRESGMRRPALKIGPFLAFEVVAMGFCSTVAFVVQNADFVGRLLKVAARDARVGAIQVLEILDDTPEAQAANASLLSAGRLRFATVQAWAEELMPLCTTAEHQDTIDELLKNRVRGFAPTFSAPADRPGRELTGWKQTDFIGRTDPALARLFSVLPDQVKPSIWYTFEPTGQPAHVLSTDRFQADMVSVRVTQLSALVRCADVVMRRWPSGRYMTGLLRDLLRLISRLRLFDRELMHLPYLEGWLHTDHPNAIGQISLPLVDHLDSGVQAQTRDAFYRMLVLLNCDTLFRPMKAEIGRAVVTLHEGRPTDLRFEDCLDSDGDTEDSNFMYIEAGARFKADRVRWQQQMADCMNLLPLIGPEEQLLDGDYSLVTTGDQATALTVFFLLQRCGEWWLREHAEGVEFEMLFKQAWVLSEQRLPLAQFFGCPGVAEGDDVKLAFDRAIRRTVERVTKANENESPAMQPRPS